MGHVIAVMPASGGVGATTFAAALAVRAAQAGRAACAVDLDRFGGRLDVVLGAEQEPGWRWPQLSGVAGVVQGDSLAQELPRVLAGAGEVGVPVLARGRAESCSVEEAVGPQWLGVLPDVVRGLGAAHQVTVLDVGRDVSVVAAVAPLVDAWVSVVGTLVPQLAAAAAAVPLLRAVVDGSAGGASGGALRWPCEPWIVLRGSRIEDDVADAVSDHLDVPVVARVRDDLRLVTDVTCGRAPGARGRGGIVEAADEVLLRLVTRPPLDAADRIEAEQWRWSA